MSKQRQVQRGLLSHFFAAALLFVPELQGCRAFAIRFREETEGGSLLAEGHLIYPGPGQGFYLPCPCVLVPSAFISRCDYKVPETNF